MSELREVGRGASHARRPQYPREAQIVYTLALKYLCRDYIKAKVYTIWVHGPLGYVSLH